MWLLLIMMMTSVRQHEKEAFYIECDEENALRSKFVQALRLISKLFDMQRFKSMACCRIELIVIFGGKCELHKRRFVLFLFLSQLWELLRSNGMQCIPIYLRQHSNIIRFRDFEWLWDEMKNKPTRNVTWEYKSRLPSCHSSSRLWVISCWVSD